MLDIDGTHSKRMSDFNQEQRNGLAAARTAASQRRALRQALQSKLISYLLAVGNLAAKDRRELAE